MGYSGAQGTLIYEKNLKSKISCQTPFNGRVAGRQIAEHEWLSLNFLKNVKWSQFNTQGSRGKWFMTKTLGSKFSCQSPRVPFTVGTKNAEVYCLILQE